MGEVLTSSLSMNFYESGTLTTDPLLANSVTTTFVDVLQGYESGTLTNDPLLATIATTSEMLISGFS